MVLRAVDGTVDPGTPIVLSGSAGRMRFPPAGLFGAGPGSLGRIEVNGEAIGSTSAPEVVFRAGDVVRLLLPAGGGYGNPRRRDRALIQQDLQNGYVTPEAVRRVRVRGLAGAPPP